MGKSLALLHKKHRPHDGIKNFSWLHPCRKLSGVHEPVKRGRVKKGKEESDSSVGVINTKDEPSLAAHPTEPGINAKDEPSLAALPAEPAEMDCPIRCPQPEPGINHDGWMLKEIRRKTTVNRRGEFTFLTDIEAQSLLQRHRQMLNDRLIFPSASAPEPSISHLL